MSLSFGGAPIKRLTFTKSWGLTPGSALVTCAGVASAPPGSGASFSLGGSSFIGVVRSSAVKESSADGRTTEISVSDNRVRLDWDTVYCVFNMVEVIEDDPDLPFIQRAKRFWHILPENWHAQTRTYSKKPLTGAEICNLLFSADTVQFSWSGAYNSKFNQPVFGLDYNTGRKLGNALQEVCDKLGVLFTVEGANVLTFATKGEGTAPQPSLQNSDDRLLGSALGPETKVRIVGDRNVYQDLPIDLEPDWLRNYEAFWFQPAWIAEVRSKFGITDYGEATARSKEITMREYAGVAGPQYADPGTWGDISRAELPVWAYLTDIVFKSYRVPRSFTVNNIPLSSLALREGLLYGVKLISDTSGQIDYDPGTSGLGNTYPDAKAYCIVKGQPLSIINPETYDSITPEILAAASQKWQPMNRFSLDQKNFGILFEEPVFFSNDLYVRANPSTTEDALKKIVVPNARATIAPAQVRASLCFEAERYARWFGSGDRHGVQYVPGLNYHALYKNRSWLAEVFYGFDTNGTADALSDKAAAAYLTGQNIIESGGFTRYGTAGMTLNGAIDRVTATLEFTSGGEGEGISEQVEYAKERSPTSFESERELERRSRGRDLFPGQSRLIEESRQDRALSRLLKSSKNPIDHPLKTLDQISTCLLGNPQASVSYAFLDSDFSYPVGMPVLVDQDDIVASTGERFAGCLTVDNSPAQQNAPIPVASQGIVPCRVQGPFKTGNSVGVNEAKDCAEVNGAIPIGQVQQDYDGTDIVVVRVKMSAGDGGQTKLWHMSLGQVVPDPMTILSDVIDAVMAIAVTGIPSPEAVADAILEMLEKAIGTTSAAPEETDPADITAELNALVGFDDVLGQVGSIANQIVDAFGFGIGDNIGAYFAAAKKTPRDGDYVYMEEFGIVYTIFRQQGDIPSPNFAFRVAFQIPTDFNDPESATATYIALTTFPAPDIPALAQSLANAILGMLSSSIVSLLSGIISAIIQALMLIKPLIEALIAAAVAGIMAAIAALEAALMALITALQAQVAALEALLAAAPTVNIIDSAGDQVAIKVLLATPSGISRLFPITWIDSSTGVGYRGSILNFGDIESPNIVDVDWRLHHYLDQQGNRMAGKFLNLLTGGYPKAEDQAGKLFRPVEEEKCDTESIVVLEQDP